VKVLQQALDDAGIALTIVPGHEVRLYEDVLADWDDELAGPLGDSRYVLAEPDFYRFDRSMVKIVLAMIDRGYTPVLAHPERIIPIQEDLSLIEPILEQGGLVQVTTDNLAPPDRVGPTGAKSRPLISTKAARHTAREMLQRGWVHIIASDAHNTSTRRPGLSAARDAAAKIVGAAQAQAMVITNPQAILDDQTLQLRPDQEGLTVEPPR
jgi:protein-tyrosine phosphatase